MLYLVLKYFHILGACVLIGTGSGIAFFMFMAHRTKDIATIAGTARIVVIADFVFTLTAALLQPITGFGLLYLLGMRWQEPWVLLSLFLYLFIGCFWVPVIFIQKNMAKLAETALQTGVMPERYHQLYRIWFWCGVPAFAAIALLLWLMVVKPVW